MPIMDRNRGSGLIDEHLPAGFVLLLEKHHVELAAPVLLQLAKAAVAVPFRVALPVLFPRQLQCQVPMALLLLMNRGIVRSGLFGICRS